MRIFSLALFFASAVLVLARSDGEQRCIPSCYNQARNLSRCADEACRCLCTSKPFSQSLFGCLESRCTPLEVEHVRDLQDCVCTKVLPPPLSPLPPSNCTAWPFCPVKDPVFGFNLWWLLAVIVLAIGVFVSTGINIEGKFNFQIIIDILVRFILDIIPKDYIFFAAVASLAFIWFCFTMTVDVRMHLHTSRWIVLGGGIFIIAVVAIVLRIIFGGRRPEPPPIPEPTGDHEYVWIAWCKQCRVEMVRCPHWKRRGTGSPRGAKPETLPDYDCEPTPPTDDCCDPAPHKDIEHGQSPSHAAAGPGPFGY